MASARTSSSCHCRSTARETEDERDALQFGTKATSRRNASPDQPPLVAPVYATSVFCPRDFEDAASTAKGVGYLYSRCENPTTNLAADAIAELEGAAGGALLFASGMCAISTAFMTFLKKGDHVVAPDMCYSACLSFFNEMCPRIGVDVTLVNQCDIDTYRKAIRPNTVLLYGETFANPTLDVLDLEALGKLSDEGGRHIRTMIDNTFASPYCVQPIRFGIDVSLHSCTKYLGGHSDLTVGCACFRLPSDKQEMLQIRKLFGGITSPQEAFLLHRSVKTLHVRMPHHCSNAMAVARFLESHGKVAQVFYPGLPSHPQHLVAKRTAAHPGAFSGMLAFELKGGRRAAKTFIEALRVVTFAVSLGGVESLVEHPASMTHASSALSLIGGGTERSPVSEGLVRFSSGIEDSVDLISDVTQALEKIDQQ